MAVTIVETRAETRAITGGVDTHADVHVAAALDPIGGLLGVQEFPATTAGYARLLGWLGGFGTVALVGTGGTGSYGAGLARHLDSCVVHPGAQGPRMVRWRRGAFTGRGDNLCARVGRIARGPDAGDARAPGIIGSRLPGRAGCPRRGQRTGPSATFDVTEPGGCCRAGATTATGSGPLDPSRNGLADLKEEQGTTGGARHDWTM